MVADSFITSPSWPVSVRLPLPAMRGGLDEEHVAAGAGDREAGGDAGDRRRARRLVEDPRAAQQLPHVAGDDA